MFLLDTNAVSELQKSRPNKQVLQFIVSQPQESLFISDVSLAEIRFGIDQVTDVSRRSAMHNWLNQELRPFFHNRVVSADEDIWVEWKARDMAGRRSRYTYSQPDLLIAAMAIHLGLTVVTRDTGPFQRAGALFLNPWM